MAEGLVGRTSRKRWTRPSSASSRWQASSRTRPRPWPGPRARRRCATAQPPRPRASATSGRRPAPAPPTRPRGRPGVQHPRRPAGRAARPTPAAAPPRASDGPPVPACGRQPVLHRGTPFRKPPAGGPRRGGSSPRHRSPAGRKARGALPAGPWDTRRARATRPVRVAAPSSARGMRWAGSTAFTAVQGLRGPPGLPAHALGQGGQDMLGGGFRGTVLPALVEGLTALAVQEDPEGLREPAWPLTWRSASARRAKAEKPHVGRPVTPKPSAVATPMRRLVKPAGAQAGRHADKSRGTAPASAMSSSSAGISRWLCPRPTPETTRRLQARSPRIRARCRISVVVSRARSRLSLAVWGLESGGTAF